MHFVVNHLPIRADADWAEMARRFGDFAAGLKVSRPGVTSALLLRAGEEEAIVIVGYADLATLKDVSSNVAAPWFAENIRPYLSGPAARSVGEVLAGFA